MAGHNKWKQIKRKKAVTDSRRGALFTKLIREITIAAKQGGGDPAGNARLRTAIDAAKAENMPLDNIERAVKKGTGELEGIQYEEVSYEGYGPGGAAIFIEATTDNANRTVAEIRHLFQRYGGNLGAAKTVAWMFDRKAHITLDATKVDEDPALEAALDAGAEDRADQRVGRAGRSGARPQREPEGPPPRIRVDRDRPVGHRLVGPHLPAVQLQRLAVPGGDRRQRRRRRERRLRGVLAGGHAHQGRVRVRQDTRQELGRELALGRALPGTLAGGAEHERERERQGTVHGALS